MWSEKGYRSVLRREKRAKVLIKVQCSGLQAKEITATDDTTAGQILLTYWKVSWCYSNEILGVQE